MNKTMEDALHKLSESIRVIGVKRAEMDKMQKEVDEKKKEFEKMNKDMSDKQKKLTTNWDDLTKRNELLGRNEEELRIALNELKKTEAELKIALDELVKTNMNLDNLKRKEEILRKEIVKFQEEMKKLQVVKRKDKHVYNTMAIEKLREKFSSKRNEMEKLQKDIETVKKEQMKAKDDFTKKREERDKNLYESKKGEIKGIQTRDTGPLEETVRNKQEEIRRLRNEIEHVESELVDLQRGFKELKIWQHDFIDDQIKPRLESYLKEIGSSDAISDTLDDLRLLVLDERRRGGCNEMLSVHKLCSDPIVKIISAKRLIQTAFMDGAKVLNLDKLDKDKSATIWKNSDVSKIRGVYLESAVFEVSKFPNSFPDFATINVKIAGDDETASSVYYQAVWMSEEKWDKVSAELQDGYVKFPLPPSMKHLFIIARGKWKRDTLTPEGLDLKCDDDENITIRCRPGSVKTQSIIRTQVMYPNPVEKTKFEDPHDDINIDYVSPSLSIKLDDTKRFEKPITVTLPGPSTPSNMQNAKLCLVEVTEDNEMHISEVISGTQQNCAFEVEHPTRNVIARIKDPIQSNDSRWKKELKHHFSYIPTECKIVVFSALYVENTIWVEVLQSERVADLKALRSEQSLSLITNAVSKRISVCYEEAITVRAQKGIRISPGYNEDYMQIKFTENEDDNNLTFGVEIVEDATSAELAFALNGTQVYICRFNTTELLKKRSVETNSRLTDDLHDLAIFVKSKTLSSKSLSVLAYHIPVDEVVFLALGLGLLTNDVDHLRAAGHNGRVLTLYVLITWRDRHINDDFDDMISELAEALEAILRKKLASAVKEASKMKRCLNSNDFAEEPFVGARDVAM